MLLSPVARLPRSARSRANAERLGRHLSRPATPVAMGCFAAAGFRIVRVNHLLSSTSQFCRTLMVIRMITWTTI